MLPDAVHDEGIVTHLPYPVDSDVTKPPLIAWTAWQLFEHQPDLEFLMRFTNRRNVAMTGGLSSTTWMGAAYVNISIHIRQDWTIVRCGTQGCRWSLPI